MLHDLLDNTTKRRIKLLETMLFYDRWIASSDLAKICNTSSRTINNDLQYLRSNYPEFFTIETSKQHGVRLKSTNYFRLEQFYRHLINEDSIFQLMEGIFLHPQIHNQTWIESLYLSTSSFYRLYKRIQSALEDYDIYLDYGYCSKNEIALRYFFSNFFAEKYGYNDWPFALDRNEITNHIKDVASYIQNKYFKNDDYYILDSQQILHLAMLIAVCAIRIKQGHHFEASKEQHQSEEIPHLFYEQAKHIFRPIFDTISLEDYEEIYYSIFAFTTAWNNEEEFAHINHEIAKFIQNIADESHIPISKTEMTRIRYMMLNKYSSYKVFSYEEELIFNRDDFIGHLIFENYPDLFQFLVNDLDQLAKKTSYPWLKDMAEIIFNMIVKWPALTQLFSQNYPKLKAILISDLGGDHQEYLKRTINHIFSNYLDIEGYPYDVFHLKERMQSLKEQYDLIILSFNYDEILGEEKTLSINPILNDLDFKNINQCIQNFYEEKDLTIPKLYADSLMNKE